jgi:hypothetical protein
MAARIVKKEKILTLMRRLGLGDKVEQAKRELPEEVDLDRHADQLRAFGLGIDSVVDQLGGSAW